MLSRHGQTLQSAIAAGTQMALWSPWACEIGRPGGHRENTCKAAAQPRITALLFHCAARQSLWHSLRACRQSEPAAIYRCTATTITGPAYLGCVSVYFERQASWNSAAWVHQHSS